MTLLAEFAAAGSDPLSRPKASHKQLQQLHGICNPSSILHKVNPLIMQSIGCCSSKRKTRRKGPRPDNPLMRATRAVKTGSSPILPRHPIWRKDWSPLLSVRVCIPPLAAVALVAYIYRDDGILYICRPIFSIVLQLPEGYNRLADTLCRSSWNDYLYHKGEVKGSTKGLGYKEGRKRLDLL